MFLEVYYRRDRPDPFVHWNMGHDVRPLNAYAAKYVGSPSGDDILAFGADRFDNSGTAFIGFAAADGRFRKGPLATDAYLLCYLLLLLSNRPAGSCRLPALKNCTILPVFSAITSDARRSQ